MTNAQPARGVSRELRAAEPLRLYLFGTPKVTLPDSASAVFEADNALALLAYLALAPEKAMPRVALAALMYPDQDSKQAMQNFRQALFRLRRAIHDEQATPDKNTRGLQATPDKNTRGLQASPAYLLSTPETIQFNAASAFWLDAAEFDADLALVQKHKHRRLDVCRTCMLKLARVADLYQGDLLASLSGYEDGPFGEWLCLKREYFRRRVVDALHTLIQYHRACHQPDSVELYCTRLTQIEPLDEPALRAQMEQLTLKGERNRALALYRDFQTRLKHELDVLPEPETTQLVHKIKSNQPLEMPMPLHRPQTLLTAQSLHGAALPNTLIPFVDRMPELAELEALLASRDCRLITLTGPCGSGKTRLAMRAASGDVTAWKHGVWLALCADVSLRDPVQIVARALGVNASSPSMLRAELCDHLRPRELLLVLDNAECCSDAADLIKVLLYSAPELKIIATSLECIGVRGEMVIRVDGLHYPDAPPAADVTLDAWLEQYPAVALFGANATRAKPGWTLTREDAPHVAHICQLVEGNPLALELAGAWARWLSCEQIAAKMNTSFDFLSRAHADLAPRCTTLRGAFEYAWTRLSLAQQSQMKKLAGLDCAFTADTAQRGAGVSLDELAVLGDKSMLRPLADSRFEIYALHMPYLREKLPRAGHALSAGEGASAFVRAPVVAAGAGVAV